MGTGSEYFEQVYYLVTFLLMNLLIIPTFLLAIQNQIENWPHWFKLKTLVMWFLFASGCLTNTRLKPSLGSGPTLWGFYIAWSTFLVTGVFLLVLAWVKKHICWHYFGGAISTPVSSSSAKGKGSEAKVKRRRARVRIRGYLLNLIWIQTSK